MWPTLPLGPPESPAKVLPRPRTFPATRSGTPPGAAGGGGGWKGGTNGGGGGGAQTGGGREGGLKGDHDGGGGGHRQDGGRLAFGGDDGPLLDGEVGAAWAEGHQ